MANAEDIKWFKTNLGASIRQAVQGTVFDEDMLTAIACQETGELWGAMRKKDLPLDRIVALCCGDTLDADRGRRAFPRTKAHLVAVPRGQEMFDIGRQALLAMAEHIPAYAFARNRPNKFCHGYGVFQYDLQFFLTNPSYFLERRYERFEGTLERALGELRTGLRTLGLHNRQSITDLEFCHVAICYNTGRFRPERGLQQGHESGGKFYGEHIRDYLALARITPAEGRPSVLVQPGTGETAMEGGGTVTANGPKFKVTAENMLFLRSAPRISSPRTANVLAELPQGHIVTSITGREVNGFIEFETLLGGKLFRGFSSARFLSRLATGEPAIVAQGSIPAANLRHGPNTVVKRTAMAGAFSLNETAMPSRTASDPAALREELGGIIGFLAPEKSTHRRYLPRDGLTFCNIYVHDYCSLAGAYLPRVWWNGPALMQIASGATLQPLLGSTVDEVRANGLFRWLRDFGQQFGWRRAATVDEIQEHANLGGISTIVARRRQDGRSGHIVMVVPETGIHTAQRGLDGRVLMPLQSQAGAVNFSYGRGTVDWWLDEKFAEFAFWMHA